MKKYTIDIPVHFSDSDRTGHMSAVSVMRAMIESSMRHSASVRTADFRDTWVLYQWEVDFLSFPRPGTTLTATTWTTGFYKFYAYRRFVLKDGERTVAEAKTVWLLLDEKTSRPRRVPEAFAQQYGAGLLSAQPAAVREPAGFEEQSHLSFPVRTYHIDGNQHVNNLVYADWILEAIPESFRREHRLQRLVLTYRRQVVYPETVRSAVMQSDTQIHHRILDTDGDIRAWGQTEWAPI